VVLPEPPRVFVQIWSLSAMVRLARRAYHADPGTSTLRRRGREVTLGAKLPPQRLKPAKRIGYDAPPARGMPVRGVARRWRSTGKRHMAGQLVLVIDDSPTIVKVVQLVLTKGGSRSSPPRTARPGSPPRARARRASSCSTSSCPHRRLPVLPGSRRRSHPARDPGRADERQGRSGRRAVREGPGDRRLHHQAVLAGAIRRWSSTRSPNTTAPTAARSLAAGPAEAVDALASSTRQARDASLRQSAAAGSRRGRARISALFALADATREDGRVDDDARVPTDAGAIADASRSRSTTRRCSRSWLVDATSPAATRRRCGAIYG